MVWERVHTSLWHIKPSKGSPNYGSILIKNQLNQSWYRTTLWHTENLTHSQTVTPFDESGKEAFWKHCGKMRNCKQFLIFPQCFLLYQRQKLFLLHLSSANALNLVWSKILSCGTGLKRREFWPIWACAGWHGWIVFANALRSLFTGIAYFYFMLSGRISRNIGENIFRSYTGNTSENTDFHVLVA